MQQAKSTSGNPEAAPLAVRERILAVASALFYREGVRAIGVDLIVERAGVAKTSLYRHFKTKDDLIEAFLRREDLDFWGQWDKTAALHVEDATAELGAQLTWIGGRIARPRYRGCPQINTAIEFPAPDHPAAAVAQQHKSEMRIRLRELAQRIGVKDPDKFAKQLALVIDGGLVSGRALSDDDPAVMLESVADALIAAG